MSSPVSVDSLQLANLPATAFFVVLLMLLLPVALYFNYASTILSINSQSDTLEERTCSRQHDCYKK